MFSFYNKKTKQSGYTLLEAVIYLAILVMVILVVIGLLIVMISGQERVRMVRDINRSGALVLEKISREIRKADSVNLAGPNSIELVNINDEGVMESIQFYGQEDNLWFGDGDAQDSLLVENVVLSNLNFTQIDSGDSSLILISLVLSHSRNLDKQEIFRTAVSLR